MSASQSSTESLQSILEHYRKGGEAERLFAGPGVLERMRTQEIIMRHLGPPPARVLDVGGGPGAYARWLVEEGYDVELIDLVPEHVEEARRHFQKNGSRASARVGDARHLDVPDQSCDCVMLLGPLYHLTLRDDRVRALSEALRVLRPGGFAFVAAISRFASLLDGFSRSLVQDPEFVTIMQNDLNDGRHENPTGKDYFTTAFLHRPEELASEIDDAGFALHGLHAVEGPFWFMNGFAELWDDPATQKLMLEMLRRIESESSLLGASAHWIAVAQRRD